MNEKELLVRKIENGTVIDHIPNGKGLKVANILNIINNNRTAVVLLNVLSKKLGRKDIVKVEGREISEGEASKIALIAPEASLNIIRNWKVVEKKKISLPKILIDVVNCPNTSCISNSNEPIKSKLIVEKKEPLKLRCFYCERVFDSNEIKI